MTLASVTPRYFAPVRELDILLLCLVTVTNLATAPPEHGTRRASHAAAARPLPLPLSRSASRPPSSFSSRARTSSSSSLPPAKSPTSAPPSSNRRQPKLPHLSSFLLSHFDMRPTAARPGNKDSPAAGHPWPSSSTRRGTPSSGHHFIRLAAQIEAR